MKNVAIIGCGQLGRRHIQGLGKSKHRIKVHVYDHSRESLRICKLFIADISDKLPNLEFDFFDDLTLFGSSAKRFDFIIVASTANHRARQFEQLLTTASSHFWLVEKPLTQSPHELEQLQFLLASDQVWVNHWRRLSPLYRILADRLTSKKLDCISVSGPNLGIGCNISHYVDLVNYLSAGLPIKVDAGGLRMEWHNSKRNGFKEIDGVLKVEFTGNIVLTVTSDNNLKKRVIEGRYNDSNSSFYIDEAAGTATFGEEELNGFKNPYQSDLTGLVFDQIDETGVSQLTTLDTAVKCYQPIIEALLRNWNSTRAGAGQTSVPLT